TDDERRMEKYRVLVNRVDISKPDWPDVPVSQ
ncbi:phage tail protein, partial [Salmonella enterica]|nr:phage tail protein [Salmonella enterica subsp. enterica serovar Adelaide]